MRPWPTKPETSSSRNANRNAITENEGCSVEGAGGDLNLLKLAGAAGFEPATGGFGDRCSTRLSYTPG